MMKRIAAVFILVVVFLSGCAEKEEIYTERCCVCGDDVEKFIRTVYGDYICASCLWKEEWQICSECGLVYNPEEFDCADGYCTGCTETETWFCSGCEGRCALNHLLDLGNGYYLCATCATPYLLEASPDLPGEVKVFSPYVPRE